MAKLPLHGKPKLKTVKNSRGYDADERRYFKALHAVVDEIFEISFESHELSWHQLAAEAGLAYQTVYNLGMRETRWPQFKTIYKLAKAVGFEIELVKNKDEAKAATIKMKKAA